MNFLGTKKRVPISPEKRAIGVRAIEVRIKAINNIVPANR